MRILHVIDSLDRGGAERNLVSVVPRLSRHEQVVVYLRPPSSYEGVLRSHGIRVEHVPAVTMRDLPRAARAIRTLARDFDVVHTQCWLSDLLGRAAIFGHAAVVTTIQTTPYDPDLVATYSRKGRAATRALRAADGVLSRFAAHRVVGVSDYVRRVSVDRLGVPPERTRCVYNGISFDEFVPAVPEERAAVRAELSLGEEDVAIVTVGKVTPAKGQHLLLDAMPSLLAGSPRAVLVIVGTGDAEARLRERAVKAGLERSVRFLGLRADVRRLLGAMDVFVLASRLEGFPLSALEALASELPCVLSAIPPHLELRDALREGGDDPADVVAVPSAEAWAEPLRALSRDRSRREHLGRLGRQRARRLFDVSVSAAALERVFEEVVAEARARSPRRSPAI